MWEVWPRALTAVVALAAALAGCAETGATGGSDVTVLAAASLTDAFEEIGAAFESTREGVTVSFSFAGSSTLREQILAGAPADVFASASPAPMADLEAAGRVRRPRAFATNRLQIAVPAGNPAGVTGIDDLAEADLLVGLCAREVPCGELARRVLRDAGVEPAPDTEETDVRALLTKLAAGELDVGLVYATDVRAAGDAIEGIELPASADGRTTYPIAVTADADRLAADLVDFVLADDGQRILRDHGFGAR